MKKPILEEWLDQLSKDLVRLTDFEAVMILFNLLILFSAITPFVFILNLTFTFTYLTTSQVPFYDSSLLFGLGSYWFDRFGFEWYIVISDFFYILVPMFQIFVLISSNVQRESDWGFFNNVFLALVAFIKLFTAVWRAWQLWFCYDFNICRCFSPGCCNSLTDCGSNFPFQYLLGYNLAFLLILVIYGFVSFSGQYKSNIKEQDEVMQKFLRLYKRGKGIPLPYPFASAVWETDRRNIPGVKKAITGVKTVNKKIKSSIDVLIKNLLNKTD